MAPRPLTQPAHGVMPTRPQIMPLTPPRNVGFRSFDNQASMIIHTTTPVAVARFVLMTAPAMLAPA